MPLKCIGSTVFCPECGKEVSARNLSGHMHYHRQSSLRPYICQGSIILIIYFEAFLTVLHHKKYLFLLICQLISFISGIYIFYQNSDTFLLMSSSWFAIPFHYFLFFFSPFISFFLCFLFYLNRCIDFEMSCYKQECSKTFTHPASLKRHAQIHTGNKNFKARVHSEAVLIT